LSANIFCATTASWTAQAQGVGARDGDQAVLVAAYPGHRVAVVESDHQSHPHRHPSGQPFHHPHHIGGLPARRHEIGHAHRAIVGVPLGVHDQGVVAVSSPGRRPRSNNWAPAGSPGPVHRWLLTDRRLTASPFWPVIGVPWPR
jgi:hypothetical protein